MAKYPSGGSQGKGLIRGKTPGQMQAQAAIRGFDARRAAAHLRVPLRPGRLAAPPVAVTARPPGRKLMGIPSGLPQDVGDLTRRGGVKTKSVPAVGGKPMARPSGFPFVAPGGADQMGSLTGGPITMVERSGAVKKIRGSDAVAKPGRRGGVGKANMKLGSGGRFAAKERKRDKGGWKVAAAKGFEGIVDRPTQFLVGERGPERVSVSPVDRHTAEIEARLLRTMNRFQRSR